MTDKTNLVTTIVLSIIAISVTLTTTAHADTSDILSFKMLQNQLNALRETLFEQKCSTGMVVNGIDSNGHVICEDERINLNTMTVIPFTTADMGYGTDTKYVGAGNSLVEGINPVVIPVDGTITNLVSRSNITPDTNEFFIVTLLKNGQETLLTCTIFTDEKTCNDMDKVTVSTGDTIEAKIMSSVSTDPEPLYVNTSVLFTKFS